MILEVEELYECAWLTVFHGDEVTIFKESINFLEQEYFSFDILWNTRNFMFLILLFSFSSAYWLSLRVFHSILLDWVHIFQIFDNIFQIFLVFNILEQLGNKEVKDMGRFDFIVIFLNLIGWKSNHIMLWKPKPFKIYMFYDLLCYHLFIVNDG